MKHLMVDLATLLACSCSIYVSLDFLRVCGSSDKEALFTNFVGDCYTCTSS